MDSNLNFENDEVKDRYYELAEIYAIHHVNWKEGITIDHATLDDVEEFMQEVYEEKRKNLS